MGYLADDDDAGSVAMFLGQELNLVIADPDGVDQQVGFRARSR